MNENIDSLIIGVWAPAGGNPRETITYRSDRTVSMAMFGGLLHMEGLYSFVKPDVIETIWYASPSAEADKVIGALNESLDEGRVAIKVRIVEKSVMRVHVSEDELQTTHLEKGRVGNFYRVNSGGTEDI
jgi:hypothetical protein